MALLYSVVLYLTLINPQKNIRTDMTEGDYYAYKQWINQILKLTQSVPQILAERRRVISQQRVDKPEELHDPLVLP